MRGRKRAGVQRLYAGKTPCSGLRGSMSATHYPVAVSGVRKAVLPAAGLGTRLYPLTHAFPKELLPVGPLPVLAHIARELRLTGITEALFIISERKPQIPAYFGENYVG